MTRIAIADVAGCVGTSWRRGALMRSGVVCRAILLSMASLSCFSCAETGTGRERSLITANSSASAPNEILAQLAREEATSRNLQPMDVTPPPGIAPGVLQLTDASNERANVTYEKALRELADNVEEQAAREAPRAWLEQPPLSADDAVQHYVLGRDAAQRQQYDTAIRELLLAHNFDAHSTTVARELARVYASVRNQPASADMYEHLLAVAPNDGEAVLALALYAASRQEFERAGYLMATHRLAGDNFEFDPAGEALAQVCLVNVFDALGYDRATAETGERALKRLETPPAQGMYSTQFGTAYRQRGELWRRVGDARCRLGAFSEALTAYDKSAELPTADAWELLPRRVYTLLRLGRIYGAQEALYQHLAQGAVNAVDVRDVRMCAYIAEHIAQRDLLADAVLQLHEASPTQPALVRCAATLVDRQRAIEILGAFVNANANDIGVLQQFLDWLARGDLSAAADLASALSAKQPERMDQFAACLIHAAIDPTPLLAALEQGEQSAVRRCLLATVQQQLGALGEAWTVSQQALATWPDSAEIARLRIALAADLQEPALLDDAMADVERFDDVRSWIARAQAHRTMKELRQAQDAAAQAISNDPNNVDAMLELARTQATVALAQASSADAKVYAWDATHTLEHVLDKHPDEDRAYELLLFLFGSEGPLTSADAVDKYTAQLTSANPSSPLLRRLSMETAFRQARYDRALELALGLFEQSPRESAMLTYAVSAWSAMKALDKAEAWIAQRRADRAQDPVLLEPWARVKIMRGETDAAGKELEALLAQSPRNFRAAQLLEAVYRTTGDQDRALALGEARLASRPEGVQRELALASMLAEAGRDQPATERLHWITEHGSDASIEQLSAAIQVTDSIEAPKELRETLVLTLIDRIVLDHPNVSMSSYLAGLQALHSMDVLDEARLEALLGCLAQRASMDPATGDFAVALWREIAQQLVDLGKPDGAVRVLRARMESVQAPDPDAMSVLVMCTVIADAAAGNNIEDDIKLLEDSFAKGYFNRLSRGPQGLTLARLLFAAGNVHTLIGDDAGAAQCFRRCLELDSAQEMALNNLGYQRIEDGLSDAESAGFIEQAYKLAPDDPNILDTLGWLRYKQGRIEDENDPGAQPNADAADGKPKLVKMIPGAISLIRRAIDMQDGPSAEVYDHLGDALWRRGDKNGAIGQWRRSLSLLDDDTRRNDLINNYMFSQRDWGLIVVPGKAIYDREFAGKRDRTERKIDAAVDGGTPVVAPLFEELKHEEAR